MENITTGINETGKEPVAGPAQNLSYGQQLQAKNNANAQDRGDGSVRMHRLDNGTGKGKSTRWDRVGGRPAKKLSGPGISYGKGEKKT